MLELVKTMEHSGALEAESRSAGQKFFAFTKPFLSFPCRQEPANCPYNEPDESCKHPFVSVEISQIWVPPLIS
jgi:hypothetical protein